MSYVTMNVIRVPGERREEFEQRFANRASQVEGQPGFEAFELLRPEDGDRYVVYTRWASKDAFLAWVQSPAFMEGHRAHREGGPISNESEIWTFDTIQAEYTAG